MHFSQRIPQVILLVIGGIFPSYAAPITHVELSIKPSACTVKNTGDFCTTTLNIHWQAAQPISSCLYQGNSQKICWQNKKHAQQQLAINIDQDMEFTLMHQDNTVYAKQLVRVITSQPKRYRRRLRANWSLF